MTRKSETESVFDMFAKLGHDLHMPRVDVDAILDHNRKNLEAMEKAAKAATAGASSIFNKQREMLQETMREVADMARQMQAPGSPQEIMSRQADFARRSFEAAVKNAGEVAELVRKSSGESTEVLRQRIREAMDEIRRSYEKKS